MWSNIMNFIVGKVNRNKSMQQCIIRKYSKTLRIWRQVVGEEMNQSTLSLMCAVDWWGTTRVFINLFAISIGIESICCLR
jgi:hypothetical protein